MLSVVLGQVLLWSIRRFFFFWRFHLPFGSAVLVNPLLAFNTLISASNLAKYSSSTSWNEVLGPKQSSVGLFMGQKTSEKYQNNFAILVIITFMVFNLINGFPFCAILPFMCALFRWFLWYRVTQQVWNKVRWSYFTSILLLSQS